MAGYFGRSVVQKLGIKPGFRIFAAGLTVDQAEMVGALSTENILKHDLELPMLLPGIRINTGPTDHVSVDQMITSSSPAVAAKRARRQFV